MRRRLLPILGMLGVLAGAAPAAAAEPFRWAVYYAAQEKPEAFEPYQLLVFDSDSHPPLQWLRERGKIILGYISLGEVEQYRPWYAAVRAEGILLQENRDWKGSYFVDVRDPRWTARVIETLIPSILRRGFAGIFIDTLDNPAELERQEPRRFKGTTAAAARLVETIRHHYPQMRIMLNRAYEILPQVAPRIDMVLGESVYADWDFAAKVNRKVPAALYRQQVAILKAAQQRNPNLAVMTLDYWNPEDRRGIAEIYAAQRANGFLPYVATVELDRLVPEPRP